MADLLDRIRGELQERLQESRAAALEYERLQQALAALGGTAGQDEPAPLPSRTARPAGTRRRTRARRGAATKQGQRAPRGQNRERVVRAVGDRPGVTAPELAAVSGVKGGTLYALLRRLIEEGTMTKHELPGGDTGYRLSDNGAEA